MKGFVFILFPLFLFASCSMLVLDGGALSEDTDNLLLVVDSELESKVAPELEQYREDLSAEGINTEVLYFTGEARDLRTELQQYTEGLWSAFLIGNIPAAYFEQVIEEGYEQFPVDLYYSSPETKWTDEDGNSIYDEHTDISITVPVSRIMGTPEEIQSYFRKNHRYRSGELSYSDSALIFKDDDWSTYRQGKDFGLSNLVANVTLVENISDTVKPEYVEAVSGEYRYVYQWIHAVPYSLYIQEDDDYKAVTVLDVENGLIGSGFYNMFNCKGARFSEDNLGMTYLTDTDGGLAALGSTKIGGNFEPLEFHRSLSAGLSWGKAYMNWYNRTGAYDDAWYLGMVILGDPTLKVNAAAAESRGVKGGTALSELVPPSDEEKAEHLQNLQRFDEMQQR